VYKIQYAVSSTERKMDFGSNMHDCTAAPRKDSAAWHVHVISQVTPGLGNDRDATSQYLTTKQSRKQTENADAAVPVLPAFM